MTRPLATVLAVAAAIALTGCGERSGTQPAGLALSARSQIAVISADGGAPRTLDRSREHRLPAWAPNAHRVAVETPATGALSPGVTIIDGDSGATRPLPAAAGAERAAPSWSPDGTRLAFFRSYADGSRATVEVTRAGDAEATVVAQRFLTLGVDTSPQWSPDGTRLAFETQRTPRGGQVDIAVVSVRDGSITFLGARDRDEISPRWHPDGRGLLVTSTPTRGRAADGGDLRIELIDATSRRVRVVDDGGFIVVVPAWSPDGAKIAVSGVSVAGDRRAHLYLIDVATGRRSVADAAEATLVAPSWSPDGTAVAYARFQQLAVFDLATGISRTLLRGDLLQIDSISWSPDGARVAFGAIRRHRGD